MLELCVAMLEKSIASAVYKHMRQQNAVRSRPTLLSAVCCNAGEQGAPGQQLPRSEGLM
ncbi:TPA: hypothetical protein ACH3X1_001130 [Trebouxia sp. C0004]